MGKKKNRNDWTSIKPQYMQHGGVPRALFESAVYIDGGRPDFLQFENRLSKTKSVYTEEERICLHELRIFVKKMIEDLLS